MSGPNFSSCWETHEIVEIGPNDIECIPDPVDHSPAWVDGGGP